MERGVYAGSFDPLTKGHQWVISRGLELFDVLILAVGKNSLKKTRFSMEERKEMLRGMYGDNKKINIVDMSTEYLANFAYRNDAKWLLRGVRTQSDFEYESTMRQLNSDICSEVQTVFVMPPRELSEVSSSVVRGLTGFDGWEEMAYKHVPPSSYSYMINSYEGGKQRWMKLWNKLFSHYNEQGEHYYQLLRNKYSESNRYYHNLAHIVEGFRWIDEWTVDSSALELAWWYHDFYYVPLVSDNEKNSADKMMEDMGGIGVDKKILEEAYNLIMATKHTKQPRKFSDRLIVTMDLMRLAGDREDFYYYENCIRKEYETVPLEDFCKGRTKILDGMVNRDGGIFSIDDPEIELKAVGNIKKSKYRAEG